MNTNPTYVLGIQWDVDPSASIACDGRLISYSEEERHVRLKHAKGLFPSHAIENCIKSANISPKQISSVSLNWDIDRFDNGEIMSRYRQINRNYNVDRGTLNWQKNNIEKRKWSNIVSILSSEWRQLYPNVPFPPLQTVPHHYCHAAQAFLQSEFEEALCLTIDGSGDTECTVIWDCSSEGIIEIRRFEIPHSLGWFYSAITEYLGFDAYDGEYKVMGLASYGKQNDQIENALRKVLSIDRNGGTYKVDARYIHYGSHNYSGRFTDLLVDELGKWPRHKNDLISRWHEDVAYQAQALLEESVEVLVQWGVQQTSSSNVCIGGGVGLNVKMNSHIKSLPEVSDIFCHPLCSDAGGSAGSATVVSSNQSKIRPAPVRSLALGLKEDSASVEEILNDCGLEYCKLPDRSYSTAKLLAEGLIVGWFQGNMEAGPRALGNRSILADPRNVQTRDYVNKAIKCRENWRPFCPSMRIEDANYYLLEWTNAPFMTIAFEASDRLKAEAPAIVHIDNTVRVQLVERDVNPHFYDVITEFGECTGVPVILNTSFNVNGEPIVCNALDALRTFWSTGLDALVIEEIILIKPTRISEVMEILQL